MVSEQRRLAAIMFTDIVGYSALTQQNEALALELLESHFQMLRPIFPQHGGKEIKTIGDSFMIEFASPLNAVQCAIKMQGILHAHNTTQAEGRKIQIRIGIHVGDVETREADVFGDGVNIAARIEPLAEAGGICVTQQVHDQIHNKLDVELESIGVPDLKNIESKIEVFKVVLPWQQAVSASVSVPAAKEISDKSIAVLPFDNMSADADNEYFSDGITEDIIAQLAKIGDLKVISRTSIMQYKGTDKNIRQIGQELGVRNVLEGSVRRAGNQVRIVAQLIHTESDEHLWADTYDRELTNIFEIQSDVAQHIASALKAKVSPEVQARIEQTPTDNVEAYELYLKGMQLWANRDKASLDQAKALFEQALELDPNYALAYVGLANVNQTYGNFGNIPPKELYPEAIEFLEKALSIDPNSGEALAALATIKATYLWDWEGAEEDFKRAIEMTPNAANIYYWYSFTITHKGRHDEGINLLQKALDLDPLSLVIQIHLNLHRFHTGDKAGSIIAMQAFAAQYPEFGMINLYLGGLLAWDGQYQESLDLLKKATASEKPDDLDPTDVMFLGYNEAKLGNRGQAFEHLSWLLEKFSAPYVSPTFIAVVYIGLEDYDKAIEWLQRGYDLQDDWLRSLKIQLLFDPIRGRPEFQELLKKIGLGP
jgi:TolB-like protein/class 3 adenylate cyclase